MKWILILIITFTAAFSAAECVHVTQSEFEEAKKELLEIDPPIDVDTTLRQRMDACHEMCVKDYVPDTVCLFKTDKKKENKEIEMKGD